MDGSPLHIPQGESYRLSALSTSFSVFINKITNMSKNVSIEADLCQVLDDFLLKLSEGDRYLANGILNTNFAEAALILQSSADLYGKKVDMLWDIIIDYQKHIVLYEEKNAKTKKELDKVEERKRKYKRKKHENVHKGEVSGIVTTFHMIGGDVGDTIRTLTNPDTGNVTVMDSWDMLELTSVSDHRQLFTPTRLAGILPNHILHCMEDHEYIGRYDQFHTTSLLHDMLHLLKKQLLLDDFCCLNRLMIDCFLIYEFLRERDIPCDMPRETYIDELVTYVHNHLDEIKDKLDTSNLSFEALKQLCLEELQPGPAQTSYVLLRDPDGEQSSKEGCSHVTELQKQHFQDEKQRRMSMADSLFDSQFEEDISSVQSPQPQCPDAEIERIMEGDSVLNASANSDQSKGLETRNKSCSQDSAFFDCEDEHMLDEVLENTEGPPALPPTPPPPVLEPQPPTIYTLAASAFVVPALPKALKLKKIDLNKDQKEKSKDKPPRKKPRLSEKQILKLITGVSTNYKNFEQFYRDHYNSEEGEGKAEGDVSDDDVRIRILENVLLNPTPDDLPPVLSPAVATPIDDTNLPDGDDDLPHCSDDLPPSPEPDVPEDLPMDTDEFGELENANESGGTTTLSQQNRLALLELYSNTAGDTSEPTQIPSELPDIDLEQEEMSRKNVKEWRRFIVPKLRTMENRSDFDIHEYGSRIIENTGVGETRMFGDFVAEKSSAEVARYFIATLQLANTLNIEIEGNQPGKLANDTFRIRVLDKTKHHELLEEYQAPSEETFRERLEQAQAMNLKRPLFSTPCAAMAPSPAKKARSGRKSKKNLFD